MGSLNGESGNLVIQNGSTLSNTGSSLNLGARGNVIVFRGDGYIGLNFGSTGEVLVTGNGSTWTNSRNLVVGFHGSGKLEIADGGTVSNSTAYIGYMSNSTSEVLVTGEDSTWTNSGELAVCVLGTGKLEIADGGTVSVGGTTNMGGGGTIDVQTGGLLQTHNLNATSGTFNLNGGTLHLTGTYTGNLLVGEGATFTGGNTVTGNLTNEGILSPGSSPASPWCRGITSMDKSPC